MKKGGAEAPPLIRNITVLDRAFDHHLLDLCDGLGRVKTLGAGFRAVHNGMAAVEFEGIFKLVQTLARGLIPAINNPAVGVQERGWPEIAIAIPPIGGARC